MLSLGQPWGRKVLPKGTFPSVYEAPSFWVTNEPRLLLAQSQCNLVLYSLHIKKKYLFVFIWKIKIQRHAQKNPLCCRVIDRKKQWSTSYYIQCLFLHWKLLLFLPDSFAGNYKVKMFYYANYILLAQCFKMKITYIKETFSQSI